MLRSILFIIFAILINCSLSHAQCIKRGPYLQQTSTDQTLIVWELSDTSFQSNLLLNTGTISKPKWKQFNPIASEDPSFAHRYVSLKNLKSAKSYIYQINCNGDLSSFFRFKTHSKTQPLKIAVFGDSGAGTVQQQQIADRINNWSPDLLFHTGDLVYSSGTLNEYDLRFFPQNRSLISKVSLYPSIGNHDQPNSNVYKRIFHLPNNSDVPEDYYYKIIRNTALIVLNSNLDYSVGSTQYNWLNKTLRSSKVKNAKFRIVMFHHPVLTVGAHRTNTDMHNSIVPLFERHGVSLVLNGHDHNYQRFIAQNLSGLNLKKKTKSSLNYIVTGGGGYTLYDQTTNSTYLKSFIKEYHYLQLSISSQKISIKVVDINGATLESYSLR